MLAKRVVLLLWLLTGCRTVNQVAPLPDPGEQDGSAATDVQGSRATGDGCPPHQIRCDGSCVASSVDPDNCGACGRRCGSGEACSGGTCSASCSEPLLKCDRRCVDAKTDSANCGQCGRACAAGTGCAAGGCASQVPVQRGPTPCPPIIIPGAVAGKDTCAGNVAQVTFRWGLCSCGNITFRGPPSGKSPSKLLVDGFDSRKGPYKPGEKGGGLGGNGSLFVDRADTEIWGPFWLAGGAGLDGNLAVRGNAQVGPGGWRLENADIDGDGMVKGNITVNKEATMSGTLRHQTGASISGKFVAARTEAANVDVLPPCDCSADKIIPIKTIVDERARKNDNASIQLDPDALRNIQADTRLDLPCGSYYLSEISGPDEIVIAAHGSTALFIGGDIRTGLTFAVDPTATFDVFIAGSLMSSDPFQMGSPNYPAQMRLYVAGTTFTLVDSSVVAGNIYAPNVKYVDHDPNIHYGAIFAGSYEAFEGPIAIHHDRAILDPADECPTTPPTAGDGGPPPNMCQSCRECNNQACSYGTCGMCKSDSDCCSGLSCYDGKCITLIE